MIDPEVKGRWLTALRSGEYEKGTGVLHNIETNCYCCLGVLARIQNIPEVGTDNFGGTQSTSFGFTDATYPKVIDIPVGYIGLERDPMNKLIALNDTDGTTFEDVAAYIEENL